MESNRPQRVQWIKVASKSRVGRYYLFNPNNGESKWEGNHGTHTYEESSVCLNPKKNKTKSPKRLQQSSKKVKTPAQDRLKKLQSKIRSSQANHANATTIPNENLNNVTTIETSKATAQKQQQTISANTQAIDVTEQSACSSGLNKIKYSNPHVNNDSLQSSETSALSTQNKQSNTSCALATTSESTDLKANTNGDPTSTSFQQIQENEKSNENVRGLSFFERIKAIYNRFKDVNTTIETNNNNSVGTVNECNNTCHKSDLPTERPSNTALRNEKDIEPADTVIRAIRCLRTVESTQRTGNASTGSANARLNSLRKSLLEQKSNDQSDIFERKTSVDLSSGDVSDTSIMYENNYSTDIQPMDWQPTEESILEKTHSDTSLCSTIKTNCDLSTRCNKWLKDHYYFIIDTNIFMLDLTFLVDLSKVKFGDTNGSVLYVPYCVLQELDHLKARMWNPKLQLLARNAIRFLNDQFKSKTPIFQTQSALDENKHLIDITSGDDSILNCCLQLKEHIPNTLLLTEDINLCNKAYSNDIAASTTKDLLAKQKMIRNIKFV